MLRTRLHHGERATQLDIDHATRELESLHLRIRPHERVEPLALVDAGGHPLGTIAPRWLCHLLGLRHASAHVLLTWRSAGLGPVFVLQIRSWSKADSPGRLDISVGGHVADSSPDAAERSAYREMLEELGVGPAGLVGRALRREAGYETHDLRPEEAFFNVEWREVFVGELTHAALDQIRFDDREVVGLYLCPAAEAQRLLAQTTLPLASALRESLPRCLGAGSG